MPHPLLADRVNTRATRRLAGPLGRLGWSLGLGLLGAGALAHEAPDRACRWVWSPVEAIGRADSTWVYGSSRGMAQVAADRQGRALVLWTEHDGASTGRILARRRVDGRWQPETELSSRSPRQVGLAAGLTLAMNPSGEAVAGWAWLAYDEGMRPQVKRFNPGTGWQRTQVMGHGQVFGDVTPTVAINARGDAWAVWRQVEKATGLYAQTAPRGSGWQATERISETYTEQLPKLALADDGRATVGWSLRGTHQTPVVASFQPGEGWGPWQPLRDQLNLDDELQHLLMSPDGRVTAMWEGLGVSDNPKHWTVMSRDLDPADGSLQPLQPLTLDGGPWSGGPALAQGPTGRQAAFWTELSWRADVIGAWLATRDGPGLSWQVQQVPLARHWPEPAGATQLSVGRQGQVTAAWSGQRRDTLAHVVTVVRLDAAGQLLGDDLLGNGVEPVLAPLPAGRMMVVWRQLADPQDATGPGTIVAREGGPQCDGAATPRRGRR
jgi:hypothetical protein